MEHQHTVLVVDDEEGIREFCVGALEDAGFNAHSAATAIEALALVESTDVDIVLTDLKMPGMDGLELLESIREKGFGADVVLMTAHGTISTAVEAIKRGAYDYITKPFALEDLKALLARLAERRALLEENELLRERAKAKDGLGGMIGVSPKMQELYRFVLRAAPKRYPVLITGESGTGKEVVARSVHSLGPWRQRPFVPVDCGALTPSLIESELFGHVRGAFTGASQDRHGLLRSAQDGTIFLDEIGELPLESQAKLLRVLQEAEFRPVGSDHGIAFQARVIAATNRDLEAAIRAKTFRSDLYYRLNVLSVKLPPLRTRREDIIPLAKFFVARYADAGSEIAGLSTQAAECLVRYDWPGNVRELENSIRRALALSAGPTIDVCDIPAELRRMEPADGRQLTYLEEVERKAILDALETTGGHRLNAAKLLGIGKTTLYSKLKEYGLDEAPALSEK